MTEPRVIARIDGRIGRISLNRPEALNALDLDMCQSISRALLGWREDPAVAAVLIDHQGPRGFCAGGDVRAIAGWVGEGDRRAAEMFLAEYRMNVLLHRYPKPTLCVMDGLAFGGGLGLAWPCRYRLATERSSLAMPESAIGLFPDVGMGWRLPRLPGATGLWFALTGARLGPADALLVGLATDYVTSAHLEALKAGFAAAPERIEERLAELESDAGDPPISLVRDQIDRCFDQPSVEAIVAALERDGSAWAGDQLKALRAGSPTTLKVAFRLLKEGAGRERLEDEMVVEHRLADRLVRGHDFKEGVRAQLIDKDRAPRWDPPALSGVTEESLDGLFAPAGPGEAWTPLN